MRYLLISLTVLVLINGANAQGPFDECGIYEEIYMDGWCQRLVLEDGTSYEIGIEAGLYSTGDTIRVFGYYFPSVSTCMFGQHCCMLIDSVQPCSLERIPGVPSSGKEGVVLLVSLIALAGSYTLWRRRYAA